MVPKIRRILLLHSSHKINKSNKKHLFFAENKFEFSPKVIVSHTQTNTLFVVVVVVKVFFSFPLLRARACVLNGPKGAKKKRRSFFVLKRSLVLFRYYIEISNLIIIIIIVKNGGKLWTTPPTISLLLLLCFSLR